MLTHPAWGLLIFLGVMFLLFQLTFRGGQIPMELLVSLFAWAGQSIHESGLRPDWLRSLLADGILQGVGGVVVFVPNIMLLFLGISVLENSGYMARASRVMDRFMHRIGLHGQSFVPMILGLGCSVPAILATRTLTNRRDRLTTILAIPFVPCGARLPIFLLLIPAFYPPAWRAPILFGAYLFGMIMALLVARILRGTLLAGSTPEPPDQLPRFRRPTVRSALAVMWHNAWQYLKKAGTIILLFSTVLWLLSAWPRFEPSCGQAELSAVELQRHQLEHSVMGRIGKGIEPVMRPLGFDWKISTAMMGALAAKEVFVSQLAVVFAMEGSAAEDGGLSRVLARQYTPLVGTSVLLFMLLTFPCLSTVAVTRKETGSWKWAALQFLLLTGVAYIIALAVYQVGGLLV